MICFPSRSRLFMSRCRQVARMLNTSPPAPQPVQPAPRSVPGMTYQQPAPYGYSYGVYPVSYWSQPVPAYWYQR